MIYNEPKRENSLKRNIIGLLITAAFGVASLFLFPYYFTAPGFVWVPILLWLRVKYGALHACLAALALSAAAWFLLGIWAGIFTLCMTGVLLAACFVCMRPGGKAEQTFIIIFFAMLAVIFGAVLLIQRFTGSDAVTNIVSLFGSFIELAESLSPGLWETYLAEYSALYGTEITTATLLFDLETTLRAQLAAQIICYCIYASAFGVLAAYRTAAKTGREENFGAKFDVYKWTLPKYTGRALGISSGALYLISGATGSVNLSAAAYTVWQLLYALFTLQGMVYLSFTMKMRGNKPWVRNTLIIALFLFLKPALFALGMLDRIMPLRLLGNAESAIRRAKMGDMTELGEMLKRRADGESEYKDKNDDDNDKEESK